MSVNIRLVFAFSSFSFYPLNRGDVMKISYNAKDLEIKEGITVFDVVSMMEDIEHKAVWVNGEHITYDQFQRKVKPGDSIRTRRIIGGG